MRVSAKYIRVFLSLGIMVVSRVGEELCDRCRQCCYQPYEAGGRYVLHNFGLKGVLSDY